MHNLRKNLSIEKYVNKFFLLRNKKCRVFVEKNLNSFFWNFSKYLVRYVQLNSFLIILNIKQNDLLTNNYKQIIVFIKGYLFTYWLFWYLITVIIVMSFLYGTHCLILQYYDGFVLNFISLVTLHRNLKIIFIKKKRKTYCSNNDWCVFYVINCGWALSRHVCNY